MVNGEKEIRVNRIVLEDKKGRVRAVLAGDKGGGPVLALLDENRKISSQLVMDKYGPQFRLCDKNGKRRVELGIVEGIAFLAMLDRKGKVRAGLSVNEFGPALELRDDKGRQRVVLGVSRPAGRPFLAMFDEKGNFLAKMGFNEAKPKPADRRRRP